MNRPVPPLIFALPVKEPLLPLAASTQALAPGTETNSIVPTALLIAPVPVKWMHGGLDVSPVAEPLNVLLPTREPRPVVEAEPDALVPLAAPDARPV